MSQPVRPPVAARRPHEVPSPQGTRTDEYYWLRDDTRADPEVIGYLEAENAYKEAVLAPLAGFRAELLEELKGRLVPDEETVPHVDRGYRYWTRYVAGSEYPHHVRSPLGAAEGAPPEVVLDVEALAAGKDYFAVGAWVVGPDQRRVAYAEDLTGRRRYTLKVRDLATDTELPVAVPDATASFEWGGDDTLLYIEKDPVTLLGNKVKRHRLGTDPRDDVVVYEERDPSFYLALSLSADRLYVLLHVRSTTSDEFRFRAVGDDDAPFTVLAARTPDLKVRADHLRGRWVIRTNQDAPDYRLVETLAEDPTDATTWRSLVPARAGIFVQDFALFDDFLVLAERFEGGTQLRIRPWGEGAERVIRPSHDGATVWLGTNVDPASHRLRFGESSLVTPQAVWEVSMDTGERHELRRDSVGGGFDPEHYETSRVWVEARDGTRVPVTIASRRGLATDGTAPLYLYGYGAYGAVIEPRFQPSLLALLDRGVRFAVAHIRGGQEMGRAWYDGGRLANKPNTFTDFVDVAEGLVAIGLADRARMAATGASAGGLLIGAVLNLRPELFRVAVADVPFVDVVTTMLDESIPLTTNEYGEWGDPRTAEAYRWMLAYSPYDNVAAVAYPALLVTSGLWDSQVQYFEPTKWVARLRARGTGDRPLLLHTDMSAGHGGASGRYRRLTDKAMEYAFVLDQLGVGES